MISRWIRSALAVLVATMLAALPVRTAPTIDWFRFNAAFIQVHYAADSAIGDLRATSWARASSIHGVSCGGDDGELHIGSFGNDLDVPAAQRPVSDALEHDDEWGLVYELPNARDGAGPSLLNKAKGQPAVFQGFFRVWNEGHAGGQVFPSNPHHVLEVHPAWGFTSGAVSFNAPELVTTIVGYRAYGITKLRQMLGPLEDGEWPLAYRDGADLVVSLIQSHNFFQFPAIIRTRTAITGGHALTVDMFSFPNFENQVFAGLRAITVTGSPADTSLQTGDRRNPPGFLQHQPARCPRPGWDCNRRGQRGACTAGPRVLRIWMDNAQGRGELRIVTSWPRATALDGSFSPESVGALS